MFLVTEGKGKILWRWLDVVANGYTAALARAWFSLHCHSAVINFVASAFRLGRDAVTRRSLHIARGAQRGADLPLAASRTCVIGADATRSDIVLRDEGVAPRHCALALDARSHVICTALDAPVRVGQRELPPGASMAMPDFLPLRCGRATLLVGPEGSDWSYSLSAASSAPSLGERAGDGLQRVRAARPTVFAALVCASTVLVAGSVWSAVSWLTSPSGPAPASLSQTQRWLLSVAPRGSALQLVFDETQQRLVVSGSVETEHEREQLALAVWRQGGGLVSEVVSRERARDEAAALAPATGAADVASPALPARRFAVLMSSLRGRQIIGPGGERWREGDEFEGMTVRSIRFDHVVFERERSPVVLYLPQLR
jgi:hypothetical protein